MGPRHCNVVWGTHANDSGAHIGSVLLTGQDVAEYRCLSLARFVPMPTLIPAPCILAWDGRKRVLISAVHCSVHSSRPDRAVLGRDCDRVLHVLVTTRSRSPRKVGMSRKSARKVKLRAGLSNQSHVMGHPPEIPQNNRIKVCRKGGNASSEVWGRVPVCHHCRSTDREPNGVDRLGGNRARSGGLARPGRVACGGIGDRARASGTALREPGFSMSSLALPLHP